MLSDVVGHAIGKQTAQHLQISSTVPETTTPTQVIQTAPFRKGEEQEGWLTARVSIAKAKLLYTARVSLHCQG